MGIMGSVRFCDNIKLPGSTAGCEKTACPVVWQRWRAQSRHLEPIPFFYMRYRRANAPGATYFLRLILLNVTAGYLVKHVMC